MGKPKLKVGVTGGIGSGKTTVCKIFEALGIPVYYADDRAKWLMANDPVLREKIREAFGNATFDEGGRLNRAYLADLVFGDPEKLHLLNSLVHPAVGLDSQHWHQEQEGVPYTVKEAALIFESGSYRMLDKVIAVYAPEALRIRRVMQRDKVSHEAVKARMGRQMSEEEKMRRADFVIYNDGRRSLVRQVWEIHRKLLKFVTF